LLFLLICRSLAAQAPNPPEGSAVDPHAGHADGHSDAELDKSCGLRSLILAGHKLGIPLKFEDLLPEVEFQEAGLSMLQLAQLARSHGLTAEGQRIDWATLRSLGQPAILFVRGSHFILADPTVVHHRRPDELIRYYEPPDVAGWLTRAQLEEQWAGHALVLGRDPAATDSIYRLGPIYHDFGNATENDDIRFQYTLTNQSDLPITLSEPHLSCGCTSATLSTRTVQPGQTAYLDLFQDLNGVSGQKNFDIGVQINPPDGPHVGFTLTGYVEQGVRLSHDVVRLKHLKPGVDATETVYFEDMTGAGVEVLEAWVEGNCGDATLTPVVEPVEPEGDITSRYAIHLLVSPPQAMPAGCTARLMLHTTSEDNAILEVPVELAMLPTLSADVDTLAFGVLTPGDERSEVLRIASEDQGALESLKLEVNAEQPGYPVPEITGTEAGEQSFGATLRLRVPADLAVAEKMFIKGHISARNGEGESLEIPYLYLIEPKG